MKKIIIIILIFLVIGICTLLYLKMKTHKNSNLNEANNHLEGENVGGENLNESTNKINININGVNYTATLEDNEIAKELVSRMPFTIEMNELNSNEKYKVINPFSK